MMVAAPSEDDLHLPTVRVMPGPAAAGGRASAYTPVPLNPGGGGRPPPPLFTSRPVMTATPKRSSFCELYCKWVIVAIFFTLLGGLAKLVSGQGTDPWAPYRRTALSPFAGRGFYGPGICSSNIYDIPGELPCDSLQTEIVPSGTRVNYCDPATTGASCNGTVACAQSYSCNLVTPLARCTNPFTLAPCTPSADGTPSPSCRVTPCACNDVCATGLLCTFRHRTTTAVTNTGKTRTINCATMSQSMADNLVKDGITATAAPAPCAAFGPAGCNSTAHSCVRDYNEHARVGDVCARRGYASVPYMTMFVGCSATDVKVLSSGAVTVWNVGCDNGGSCPAGSAALCTCPMGFGGNFCETRCPRGMSGRACATHIGCTNGGCDHGGTCYTGEGPYKNTCVACDMGWTGPYCERACKPGECDLSLNGTWLPSRTLGHALYPPGVCGVTMACKAPFPGATPGPFGTPAVDYPCGVMESRTTVYTSATAPSRCDCTSKFSNQCYTGAMCDIGLGGPLRYAYTVASSNRKPFTVSADANCSSVDSVALALSRNRAGVGMWTTVIDTSPCRRHGPNGCNSSSLACVRQNFPGLRPIAITNTSTVQLMPAMEICCPRGRIGDDCEIDAGCTVHGCDHGGFCLDRDRDGKLLKPEDTRCFGCDAGVNGTAGWGGRFCHLPMRSTWTWVANLTGTGWTEAVAARRLLQAGATPPDPDRVRADSATSTDAVGGIPREEGRVCDCGVRWNHSTSAPVATIRRMPLMRFGNYEPSPVDQVLLSPMYYNPNETNAVPGYLQVARSHREAEYKCYLDASSSGYVEINTTSLRARGFFYFGCTFNIAQRRSVEGEPRYDGADLDSAVLAPLLTDMTGLRWHSIERVPNATACPDARLDPAFYCRTYPMQCQSIRNTGGVGQIKINAQTASNDTVAFLHYQLFGHRVGNQPNAGCRMTHTLLEDQQGCWFHDRPPAFLPPPLKPNETLTAERCGNLTWITDWRIGGDGIFPFGATAGYNVTDDGVGRCICDAPFKPTGGNRTDCADDGCGRGGIDNVRGTINPLFESVPLLDKCICQGVWTTDDRTCAGNYCDWCNKADCRNMGTPNKTDPSACDCLPIFYGPRCEHSHCHANNTLQYVGTGPDIICDCKQGWTGKLCTAGTCVNGNFTRETETCACPAAFVGPRCDIHRCVDGHGTWEGSVETGKCTCIAPWTGPRCEQHTCDNYNVVLDIQGWNGTRPFGQPVVSGTASNLFECQCNWPYKSDGRKGSPSQLAGRPIECSLHDCNHGVPRGRNGTTWPSPTLPSDLCECDDPAGIGILTDPKHCTAANHSSCPNACLRATCGISQNTTDTYLGGEYVQVSSYDPSCCQCSASVGYLINDTCQSWCALYQPCITTNRSSFALNPAYNASLSYDYPDANISRAIDHANRKYICACNTHYSNRLDLETGVTMNDCGNYTRPPDDAGVNRTGPWDENPPDKPCTNCNTTQASDEGDEGDSGLSQTTIIGIVAAAGFAAATAAAQALSTAIQAKPDTTSPPPPSESVPAIAQSAGAITAGRGSRTGRRMESSRLLALVSLLLMVALSASTGLANPADPDTWPFSHGREENWNIQADVLMNKLQHVNTFRGTQISLGNALKYNRVASRGHYIGVGEQERPPSERVRHLYYKTELADAPLLFPDVPDPREIAVDLGSLGNGPLDRSNHVWNPVCRIDIVPHYEYTGYWNFLYRDRACLQGDPTMRPPSEGFFEEGWTLRNPGAFDEIRICPPNRRISTVPGPPVPDHNASPIAIRREYTCPFDAPPGATVAVGKLAVPANFVTWSMYRIIRPINVFPDDSVLTYFSINICETTVPSGPWRCGGDARGECITTFANVAETKAGFNGGQVIVHQLWYGGGGDFEDSSYIDGATYNINGYYILRACKCKNGYYGARCEKDCPNTLADGLDARLPSPDVNKPRDFHTHALCSFRGRCDGGIQTTAGADFAPCRCATCVCKVGFDGVRCERTVKTGGTMLTNGIIPTDTTECCPQNSPDCGYVMNTGKVPLLSGVLPPVRYTRPRTPTAWIIKKSIHPTGIEIIAGNVEANNQWTLRPSDEEIARRFGRDDCGTFESPSASKGVYNWGRGRGQCWTGVGPDRPAERAFCWCNPDKSYERGGLYDLVKSRGWFGTKCSIRTCTTRYNPIVQVPGPTGDNMALTLQAPLNGERHPMQCSGNSHGSYSNEALAYETSGQACRDTVKRTPDGSGEKIEFVNTDGRCELCIDGFGMYPGYWVSDIEPTTFAKERMDQGICMSRTYHSTDGGVCGGYWGALLNSRMNLLPAASGPAGTTVPARYVGGCDCMSGTLPLLTDAKSGLCRRSCGGTAKVGKVPREYLDENGMYNGGAPPDLLDVTADACGGGYTVGLCRPIEQRVRLANGHDVGSTDGYNSACMCNAGYGGPRCAKIETMWIDGTVCGKHGEFVHKAAISEEGKKAGYEYIDEWWFDTYIVPLNGESLNDKEPYSMYTCKCKDEWAKLGWEPNEFHICAQVCTSDGLMGFSEVTRKNETCSKNGECMKDPTGATQGSVCICNLGWHGENCATPILRDAFNEPCGGADHGYLAYVDSTNKYSGGQKCVCHAGYALNPDLKPGHSRYGLCMKDCPVSERTGEKCTNQINGKCIFLANGNDKMCECTNIAFKGDDCGHRLVAAYHTKSNNFLPCTGRGVPDDIRMSGGCICDEGYTGFACEMYTNNRECGAGQCFQDNEAAEIFVS